MFKILMSSGSQLRSEAASGVSAWFPLTSGNRTVCKCVFLNWVRQVSLVFDQLNCKVFFNNDDDGVNQGWAVILP